MNAVTPAPDDTAQMSPLDENSLGKSFIDRAKVLAKNDAAGARALVEDAIIADVSHAFFKPIVDAIATATGLSRQHFEKMLRSASVTVSKSTATGTGRPPLSGMHNPTPVPNPERLDKLADQLFKAFDRQIVCPATSIVAIVLWIIGTYGFMGSPMFPRLIFTSATKRCGKSTALGMLRTFVSSPLKADNITKSALMRVIDKCRPTLLIDEVDAFFSKSDELRGAVNAGAERSGALIVSAPTPDGKSWEPVSFNVYCPMALAGIGGLPDTVLDRSVIVKLQRAPAGGLGQRKRPLRHRDLEKLHAIIMPHLAAHAPTVEAAMDAGVQVFPAGLHDRAQDIWEPLFAIADLIGGSWPQRARTAALALSCDDALSQRELLLLDLGEFIQTERAAAVQAWRTWVSDGRKGWAAWVKAGLKGKCPAPPLLQHIRSLDALKHLLGLEHRPWPEFGRDAKGLTPHRLASMLKPLGIEPSKQRMPARHAHGLNASNTEPVSVYSVRQLRAEIRRYRA